VWEEGTERNKELCAITFQLVLWFSTAPLILVVKAIHIKMPIRSYQTSAQYPPMASPQPVPTSQSPTRPYVTSLLMSMTPATNLLLGWPQSHWTSVSRVVRLPIRASPLAGCLYLSALLSTSKPVCTFYLNFIFAPILPWPPAEDWKLP
jgi:hypothetical protein